MRLPFLRPPTARPVDDYSFCEPAWATTFSRIHLHVLDPEIGRQLGGGIKGPALCGRNLAGGWDLSAEVTEARVNMGISAEHNPLCWDCANAWLALR